MKSSLVIAVLCIVGLAGCSSYDIKYDYDMDSNFAAYKTYKWIPRVINEASGSARVAAQSNTLLDDRIHRAVDTQMTAKGFTMSADTADVFVVYHTGLQNKIDVTDWGYTYAGSYWGGGLGRGVDVYEYTEGTLVVDLVSSATRKLVWRGSATGVVEPGSSPEQVEQKINDVISQIFANYPPRK
jgi:hypothetical protein